MSASAPMVRPWKAPSVGDEVGAAGAAGELERGLVGLGAGVGEEHPALAAPSRREQPLGEGELRLGGEEVGHVAEGLRAASVTASTIAGWAWPRALTAMPPSRSTYSRPSASQTWAPSPRVSSSWACRRCSSATTRSARVLAAHASPPWRQGLAELGGDAGQHLGADALVGEDLQEHGVGLASVDDGGPRARRWSRPGGRRSSWAPCRRRGAAASRRAPPGRSPG